MLWIAFILGLAGSLHCVGMCGPIALLIPGLQKNPVLNATLYFGGKILAYSVVGSVFGLIPFFISGFKIQAIIAIVAGMLMLVLALSPVILNFLEKKGYQFFNFYFNFKNRLLNTMKKNQPEYSFYLGLLNGFMPCAMVYFAAIGAMSQTTFYEATLFMIFFGLGTIPAMAFFIGISQYIKKYFKLYGNKVRTLSFLLVGIFILWKGISNYQVNIDPPREAEKFDVCETYTGH